MNITIRNSPNQRAGRNGQTPDFIVMHTTGGTFAGALSWTTNPRAQVSYHFIVASDGAVTQTVPIENTAWHAGTNNSGGNVDNRHSTISAVRNRRLNANSYSVGIGFSDLTDRGTPSAAQLETAIWLVRHIRDEVRRIYNFALPITRSNIVGHDEVTPRNRSGDPGRNFPFDEIIRHVNAGSNPTPAPQPPIPPATPLSPNPGVPPSLDELARQVIRGDWGNGAERVRRLADAGYDAPVVQQRVNEILRGNNISASSPTPPSPTLLPLDEIAREVIRGRWGNGAERRQRLTAAGYDASAVQRRVNQIAAE